MIKTKKVIDTTLEEYSSKLVDLNIFKCEDLRSQYYDEICTLIKHNYIGISERVYKTIPDLHYWIYKHVESLGYKVVYADQEIIINNIERIKIVAE